MTLFRPTVVRSSESRTELEVSLHSTVLYADNIIINIVHACGPVHIIRNQGHFWQKCPCKESKV